MKALTVRQPYATLIAKGMKHVETRGYRTTHRGPIMIHSSRVMDMGDKAAVKDPVIYELLCKVAGMADFPHVEKLLPLGQILAITTIEDCIPAREFLNDPKWERIATPQQRALGWYEGANRYAWLLGPIVQIPAPIAATGHQGIWDWPLAEVLAPAEVARLIEVCSRHSTLVNRLQSSQ